jgi:hypothetical protein
MHCAVEYLLQNYKLNVWNVVSVRLINSVANKCTLKGDWRIHGHKEFVGNIYPQTGGARVAQSVYGRGAGWRWVVSFKTRPFCPGGKSHRYPLNRRQDGTRSRSGPCEVEKDLLPFPGIKPRPSSPLPVAAQTELHRLLYSLYNTNIHSIHVKLLITSLQGHGNINFL